MSLTKLLPWILAAMVASVAAMVSGIRSGLPALSWIAALMFAAAMIASAMDINSPFWSPDAAADPDAPVRAALMNSRLAALGYAWGSMALLCIYRMSGLKWQHGLQYGAGMALIAWFILLYVHLLAQPGSRLRQPRALSHAAWVSMAHGACALLGLGFLIGSGKLFSIKGDWGANQIFLAGGIAIAGLSLIAAITYQRLRQMQQDVARRPIPAGPA